MNDYHMHTALSDGEGDMDAFVARAAALGLAEIGFSDHLVPRAYDEEGYGLPDQDVTRYAAEVRRAAARSDGPRVLLGVEMDYVPGTEAELEALLAREAFDYVIGSVHFADGFAFDMTSLKDDPRWDDVDGVHRAYWETVARAAAWGRFDVIGHLDLAKKFGRRPPRAMTAAEDSALEAISAAGLAIELNTSGLRSAAGEAYPGPSLLARAAALGIPLVLGSDAHTAEDVGRDFDRAVELARAAGYESTLRLSDREPEALP
jgi:histidinol-phosphatase (PHP family)